MRKKDLILLLMLTAILIYLFILAYHLATDIIKLENQNYYCSNKSLIKTAQCLNLFVINNFKYKITDDNKTLTTKELIEEGGDCKDWTEFYERNLKRNDFENTRKEIMEMKQGEGHIFLIVWDEKSYCTLDMKDYNCWRVEL